MNTDIKLTIAIPTYNRCKLLKMTLDSIMEQWVEGVEVLVSDNASTDDTAGVVSSYPGICYYRNKENLGMDGNFLNCLQKAKGTYVHLMSDDDILLPGAVQKILKLIEDEKPDYINLNLVTYSGDRFDYDMSKYKPRIELQEDMITCDKSRYITPLGVYLTYISATIVKRENFLKIKNPQKYFGTYFLHAHLVLDMLKGEHHKAIVTKDVYLAAKKNNSGGFNLYEVWVKQYKRLLLKTAVRDGFPYWQMRKIYTGDINGFIKDSIIKYSVTENEYDMKNKWILLSQTFLYPEVWKTYKYIFMSKSSLRKVYYKHD